MLTFASSVLATTSLRIGRMSTFIMFTNFTIKHGATVFLYSFRNSSALADSEAGFPLVNVGEIAPPYLSYQHKYFDLHKDLDYIGPVFSMPASVIYRRTVLPPSRDIDTGELIKLSKLTAIFCVLYFIQFGLRSLPSLVCLQIDRSFLEGAAHRAGQ